MISKRVFAHNNNINFNDYYKNKNGIEIINNIRSKPVNPVLSSFLSYDRFILITKTYFKYIRKNDYNIQIPVNLYNSNTSFIVYESLLSHMKDCNTCKYGKDILKLYDCKELNEILYPYGKYLDQAISNPIFLHNRININDWCIKKDSCKINTNINTNINENTTEKNNCTACSNYKIKDKTCNSCSNIHTKINNYNKYSPKINTNISVYPSQNNFIFQNINEDKNYDQIQRMNAYSIYPNLNDCTNNSNNISSCKKSGLCRETKPLFI